MKYGVCEGKRKLGFALICLLFVQCLCACGMEPANDAIVGNWRCDLLTIGGTAFDNSEVKADMGFRAESDGTCAIYFYLRGYGNGFEDSNMKCVWDLLEVDEGYYFYTISAIKNDGVKVEVASVQVKDDELILIGSGDTGVFDELYMDCTRKS